MGQKTYEMQFIIGGMLNSSYTSAFRSAGTEMTYLNTQLKNLNAVQSNVNAYTRTQASLTQTQTKAASYRAELDRLKATIAQNGTATEAQLKKQASLTTKIADCDTKTQQYNTRLSELKEKLAAAGVSTDNLENDTKMLNSEYDRLAAQKAKITELSEAQQANAECIRNAKTELRSMAIQYAIVAAAALKLTKYSIDYEEAFTGVTKTVEGTTKQLNELSDAIREMSEVKGTSATELAAIAQEAGQLGIATDNIASFTSVMADLGVSTNLTGEDAAESLARFANITKMNPSDYEKLGSTIVDLGNNYATTESEIVEMGVKLAATGEIVGYTEPELLGISTALSSVGVAAQAGATAISKISKKIELAVQSGSEDLTNYAKVAGMSVEEFKKMYSESSLSGLSAFIDGLREIENSGGSAIVTLNDMGLNEVRLSNAILALTASEDLLGSAVETANEAWNENTALSEESGKYYSTASVQLENMKNALKNTAIEAGNVFLPAIKDGTQWVIKIADEVRKWIQLNPEAVKTIVKVSGAFMGLKLSGAVAKLALLSVKGGILSLQTVFVKLPVQLAKYASYVKTAGSVGSVMAKSTGSAATAIASFGAKAAAAAPIVAGVAVAVAALGAAAYAVYKHIQKESLSEMFGDLTLTASELEDIAQRIVARQYGTKIADTLSAFEKIDSYKEELSSLRQEVMKGTWKIGLGFELSEAEQSSFVQSAKDYADKISDIISQQGYAVKLGIELSYLVTGEPTTTDERDGSAGIQSAFAGLNTYLQTEISAMSDELTTQLDEAFKDGVFNVNAYEAAQKIIDKFYEIDSLVTESQTQAKYAALTGKYGGRVLTPDDYTNLTAELQTAAEQTETDFNTTYESTLGTMITEINTAEKLAEQKAAEGDTEGAAEAQKQADDAQYSYDKYIDQMQAGGYELGAKEGYVKKAEFEMNTVNSSAPEFAAAQQEYSKTVKQLDAQLKSGVISSDEYSFKVSAALGKVTNAYDELSSGEQTTVRNIVKDNKDNIESLEQTIQAYEEAGYEAPQAYKDTLAAYKLFSDAVNGNSPDNVAMMNLINAAIGQLATDADDDFSAILGNFDSAEVAAIAYEFCIDQTADGVVVDVEKMEIALSGLSAVTPVITGLVNSTKTLQNMLGNLSSLSGHATGTSSAENAFIAGERGPELVVGQRGKAVLTAVQTANIAEQAALLQEAVMLTPQFFAMVNTAAAAKATTVTADAGNVTTGNSYTVNLNVSAAPGMSDEETQKVGTVLREIVRDEIDKIKDEDKRRGF